MPFTHTEQVRAPAARISSFPLISGRAALPAWPFGELTEQQRQAVAQFEVAARAGNLLGIPSCFGDL